VAVTLVAILAAIAAPTMSRLLERADARQTARNLANALRFAHDQAMSRGEMVLVEVNTAASRGQIQVFRSDPGETSCQGVSVPSGASAQYETTVASVSGRMQIDGIADTTGSGQKTLLCFTSDGRILNDQGNPFHAQGCERKNWRLFVASERAIESGDVGATERDCLSGATKEALLDRRTARDRVDFWEIHAGYNGSIRAFQ
jgi:Tfp pilus assembly protein FimT